ncbi:hypothetical protein [Runella sp.]|uniref:hypothetical protein n=1 Tax=Runella sp. TaxID=1960881 RepID=UPI003D1098B4
MKTTLVWMKVSDLLKEDQDLSIRIGLLNKKRSWILENSRKSALAHQTVKEERIPFYNVHCLTEITLSTANEKLSRKIIGFMVSGEDQFHP